LKKNNLMKYFFIAFLLFFNFSSIAQEDLMSILEDEVQKEKQ